MPTSFAMPDPVQAQELLTLKVQLGEESSKNQLLMMQLQQMEAELQQRKTQETGPAQELLTLRSQEIQALRQGMQAARGDVQQLQQEESRLRQEIAQLKVQHEQKHMAMLQVEEQLQRATTTIRELSIESQTLKAENTGLRDRYVEMQEATQGDRESNEQRVAMETITVLELQSRMAVLEKALDEEAQLKANQESFNAALSQRVQEVYQICASSLYRVDNTKLDAKTHGMNFRLSKSDDNKSNIIVPWGCVVSGSDMGDGWLSVGKFYLPFFMNGVQVLSSGVPFGLQATDVSQNLEQLQAFFVDPRSQELDALLRIAKSEVSPATMLPASRAASLTMAQRQVDATPINDPLNRYLLALREGRDNAIGFFPADQYQVGHGVIGHESTGIIIKCPALYVANPEDDDVLVLYHYTPAAAFSRITASTDLSHLKASYAERAHFGDGVYTTQYAPHAFESKDAVLRNNYTNKADPDQQETQISRWREAGAVDYCIPIIVKRSVAVNVMFQKTKEMQKPGHTARHNEPIRADRDVWVIVVSDAAGHAESAREHPESIWIQLRHESWVARLHAVEFLAGVIATSVDSETTDAIIKCLHDNDKHVCVAAIWAVACSKALPSVRAQQLISQAIDYNTHPSVKAAIVDAIEFLSLSTKSSD